MWFDVREDFIPNDCDSVPKVTCHIPSIIQKISKGQVQTQLVKEQIRFSAIHKEEEEEEEEEEKEKKERRTRRR